MVVSQTNELRLLTGFRPPRECRRCHRQLATGAICGPSLACAAIDDEMPVLPGTAEVLLPPRSLAPSTLGLEPPTKGKL